MSDPEWLAKLRYDVRKDLDAAHMTHRSLARAIGVSQACINRFISGSATPDVSVIDIIARAMGYEITIVKRSTPTVPLEHSKRGAGNNAALARGVSGHWIGKKST